MKRDSVKAYTYVDVKAGVRRIKRPGYGLDSCFPDIANGNAVIEIADPVPTRGYPLANYIYLNTQSVDSGRLLGNATFTYDIRVDTSTYNTLGRSGWTVVDGTGKRHDFGASSVAPGTPEAGVYLTLIRNANNTFTLSKAGPPGAIETAGNFKYNFDATGKLTKITDPAGNEQADLAATDHRHAAFALVPLRPAGRDAAIDGLVRPDHRRLLVHGLGRAPFGARSESESLPLRRQVRVLNNSLRPHPVRSAVVRSTTGSVGQPRSDWVRGWAEPV